MSHVWCYVRLNSIINKFVPSFKGLMKTILYICKRTPPPPTHTHAQCTNSLPPPPPSLPLPSFVRLADNLPAATVFRNLKTGELQYEDGYKLGFSYTNHVVVNNHLKIKIKYHTVERSTIYVLTLFILLAIISIPNSSILVYQLLLQ